MRRFTGLHQPWVSRFSPHKIEPKKTLRRKVFFEKHFFYWSYEYAGSIFGIFLALHNCYLINILDKCWYSIMKHFVQRV